MIHNMPLFILKLTVIVLICALYAWASITVALNGRELKQVIKQAKKHKKAA